MFAKGKKLFGDIAERYRQLKLRLADRLLRGDKDYASLSAISQEIGRIRQRIRNDIARRKAERRSRKQSYADRSRSASKRQLTHAT